MAQAVVAVMALVAIFGMSVRANRKFCHERRLPMQWSLAGKVNWTAPRVLALSFTPALASVVLFAVTTGTLASIPRPGQEGLEVPVVLLVSFGLIGVHALHLWLIDATMKADGR